MNENKKGNQMKNIQVVFNAFDSVSSMIGSACAKLNPIVRAEELMRFGTPDQNWSPLAGMLNLDPTVANGWTFGGMAWRVKLIKANASYGSNSWVLAMALPKGRASKIEGVNSANYEHKMWMAFRTVDPIEILFGDIPKGENKNAERVAQLQMMVENGSFPKIEIITPKSGTTLTLGKKEERDRL
tara:strand:- start:4219 stop:4773 length:555 start_codon:yes stop_codon:yes gene_type:complete